MSFYRVELAPVNQKKLGKTEESGIPFNYEFLRAFFWPKN